MYQLSFSEPTFFPKLEQLLKNGSFELLCLPIYTQHLCYGWWEEEVYGDRAFWVTRGGKTVPKGKKKPPV